MSRDDQLLVFSTSLRPLAQRGELRRYRKGTLLIQEGDQGDTLYLIASGRLRAFSAADNGKEITYGTYGPGEYLGEMSLDGGPRSASVETLEASECVVVTQRTLLAHIADHPEFALELLAKVIRRARAATLSARQLALNDVYGRLRVLLEELAGPPDAQGVRVIGERLTHQQMSQHLGCSREMVSRVMKDLERGGFVDTRDKAMCLLKALPSRW
ncbi:Crp/Fnr family transcriptional regulator [Ideonella sp. 4Y11]|uniref:Crp/Fnr family transcriptional regulator n=1 Tax=Ideonella aquatica TaxID=2824119 RepID=A0A940YHF3_9BURK|nr:Crp/Fnr family transcriptional regulator [Ideonella aquatica]MBQ0960288.1 Crp/Fnr family transcriptional regulator [Ideonella aquatica]